MGKKEVRGQERIIVGIRPKGIIYIYENVKNGLR